MADQHSHINTLIYNLKPFHSSVSGLKISKEMSFYNLLFIDELKKLLLSWCQDYKTAKSADLKKNMHFMIDKWIKGFAHYSDQMHFLTKEICDTFDSQMSLLKNEQEYNLTDEDLVDNFMQYISNKYPGLIWANTDNSLLALPSPYTEDIL